MARQIADRLCSLSGGLFSARTTGSLLPFSPSLSSSSAGSSSSASPSSNALRACQAKTTTILAALTGRKTETEQSPSSSSCAMLRSVGKTDRCGLVSTARVSSQSSMWSENGLSTVGSRCRSMVTVDGHPRKASGWRLIPAAAASSGVGGGERGGREEFHDQDEPLLEREILVQHLLVKEDQLALLLELEQKINREGVDLSDLALDYSLCPSKDQGGMLGWIGRGKTVPEFEKAAFTAPLNKVVRVKTKFGWHLLQVLAERAAAKVTELSVVELEGKLKEIAGSIDDLEREDFDLPQLIDVRELEEIEQASLPYFRAFPLSQFGKWGPSVTEALDQEKETIVLCHHGVRSLQMAQWLCSQGFMKVRNVTGGIDAYSRKVDASVPTY
ncbi:hypothetical protein CBR_g54969 [Chara braunii]|uniref:Peptidylprolyl isomerase n=1 Tax=Chara braunii TaxID=69332 RepID=A0A388K7F7_CHABU|nr:hypothetical protein CBR_g54969 [Chara braunii]|eukprot:GBG65990.1 hypothetical protein CBR_g54969 [Chara braunii]